MKSPFRIITSIRRIGNSWSNPALYEYAAMPRVERLVRSMSSGLDGPPRDAVRAGIYLPHGVRVSRCSHFGQDRNPTSKRSLMSIAEEDTSRFWILKDSPYIRSAAHAIVRIK